MKIIDGHKLIEKMSREEAIETLKANYPDACFEQLRDAVDAAISALKQPEIIHCRECKHNTKDSWFGCPMSHLNERQRPEDAWCWRGKRKDNG